MASENDIVEFTERKVFLLFADVDKNSSKFIASKKEDYERKICDQLPAFSSLSTDHKDSINVLLRKYGRKKRCSIVSVDQIIDSADNEEVIMSLSTPSAVVEPGQISDNNFLPSDDIELLDAMD